jgi:hypothetical protein
VVLGLVIAGVVDILDEQHADQGDALRARL